MKEAVKGSGQASGILSIGRDVRKLADKKFQSYIMTAQKQGVDLDKLSEQEIKYMLQLNKPKPIKAISADSPEGKQFTKGLMNMLNKASGENVIKTDFGGGVTDIVTETITKIKTLKPIEAMAEANSVLGKKGKYKRLTKEQTQKIIKDTEDHIFERNVDVDPDEPEFMAHGGRTGSGLNYLLGEDDQNSRVPYAAGSTQKDFNQYLRDREQRDREEQKRKFKDDFEKWKKWQDTQGGTMDFAAEGGRAGFGLGGMGRRGFLKLMGGAAAGAGAAKTGLFGLLKSGKPITGVVTSVPIKAGVDGMPVWFKPLVNKVIKEGDDVTKQFATQERQIVHQSTLPDSKTPVTVTQDLTTGNVSVEIGLTKHGFAEGHLGQPVRLEYKASEIIEPTINKQGKVTNKGTKTKEEFNVE